jgi:hypothetical protein
LASVAIACTGTTTSGSPIASSAQLPLDAWTPSTLPGQSVDCLAIAIDATVHGSAADRAVAWLVDARSGQRLHALWPHGYAARFDPRLAVIDQFGATVLHEDDRVTRACFTGSADDYWLDPPFQQ